MSIVRVVQKFERQALGDSAKVYARPLEILLAKSSTGADRLGIERSCLSPDHRWPTEFGGKSLEGTTLQIHTRGFDFWDGNEPAQTAVKSMIAHQICRSRLSKATPTRCASNPN